MQKARLQFLRKQGTSHLRFCLQPLAAFISYGKYNLACFQRLSPNSTELTKPLLHSLPRWTRSLLRFPNTILLWQCLALVLFSVLSSSQKSATFPVSPTRKLSLVSRDWMLLRFSPVTLTPNPVLSQSEVLPFYAKCYFRPCPLYGFLTCSKSAFRRKLFSVTVFLTKSFFEKSSFHCLTFLAGLICL